MDFIDGNQNTKPQLTWIVSETMFLIACYEGYSIRISNTEIKN